MYLDVSGSSKNQETHLNESSEQAYWSYDITFFLRIDIYRHRHKSAEILQNKKKSEIRKKKKKKK